MGVGFVVWSIIAVVQCPQPTRVLSVTVTLHGIVVSELGNRHKTFSKHLKANSESIPRNHLLFRIGRIHEEGAGTGQP